MKFNTQYSVHNVHTLTFDIWHVLDLSRFCLRYVAVLAYATWMSIFDSPRNSASKVATIGDTRILPTAASSVLLCPTSYCRPTYSCRQQLHPIANLLIDSLNVDVCILCSIADLLLLITRLAKWVR